jgi:hypothetical protein
MEQRWIVEFHDEFELEFDALAEAVQDELLAQLTLLDKIGPALGRPRVDTLKGSVHANMKELRFAADNRQWRAAFAFDPRRRAIVLVAGDKSGVSQKRFYAQLIAKTDLRFTAHCRRLEQEEKQRKQQEKERKQRK